MSRWFSCYSF